MKFALISQDDTYRGFFAWEIYYTASFFLRTRSPCPKLKPVSKASKAGFLQLSTQPYGGGLWHTWFDRDLGVAGRAIVKRGEGKYSHDLVRSECGYIVTFARLSNRGGGVMLVHFEVHLVLRCFRWTFLTFF